MQDIGQQSSVRNFFQIFLLVAQDLSHDRGLTNIDTTPCYITHLEYAAAAWDPDSKKDISDIEQLQDQAVRFIAGIKGRVNVEDAKTRLGLIPLHKRRNQRLRLLMRILAKEEHHSSLSESYNEIMKQPVKTMTTRSQTSEIPATFRTNNTQYHNSFLPRTIHDLKGQSGQTISYSANTGLTPTANTIQIEPTELVLISDKYRPD